MQGGKEMTLIFFIVLLSTIIVLAWGFLNLLKLNQEKSEEISGLRLELFSAESKIAIYEFDMEPNKKGKVDTDDDNF